MVTQLFCCVDPRSNDAMTGLYVYPKGVFAMAKR